MDHSNFSRRQFLQYGALVAGAGLSGALWAPRSAHAANIGNAVPGPIATDASGLITTQIFFYQSYIPRQHFLEYEVDAAGDMLAVGGGVVGIENPGALIYSSHPNDDLSSWMIGTKDHETEAQHFVTGYVIGIKIAGMTKAELIDAMVVTKRECARMQHPLAAAPIPEDCVLLGGGVRIEWDGAGNLATASCPVNGNSWSARAKDQGEADPATLTVYAIGLKKSLSVGTVSTIVSENKSAVASHPTSIARLPEGFALCGGGGFVNYHGDGNLLWKLEPIHDEQGQGFIAASKDHGKVDPAAITAYALGVRLTPS